MSTTQEGQHPFEKFDESNFKTYNGSCHCGKVKFNASISPPIEQGTVTSCNCSICHINGYMNVYAPETKLSFLPDKETAMKDLTSYEFGKKMIIHYFCKTCGTSICGRANDKGRNVIGNIWTINSRTLTDLELDKMEIKYGDGKNLW